MKEAVGFARFFPSYWGSMVIRHSATRELMERAAWASTTLRDFREGWTNRHSEFKGPVCPTPGQTEAYQPVGLGLLHQLSTAYAALFLPIQTTALAAELCICHSQWRSFEYHVNVV